MRTSARCVAVLATLALFNACAARSASGRRAGGESASRNSLITAAELTQHAPGANLHDALERLRPTFLYPRGARSLVSIDGTAPSEQGILRSIPVSAVAEVRFIRGTGTAGRTAVLPNGDVAVGDVLLVLTRK